jgi:hypothetical protein
MHVHLLHHLGASEMHVTPQKLDRPADTQRRVLRGGWRRVAVVTQVGLVEITLAVLFFGSLLATEVAAQTGGPPVQNLKSQHLGGLRTQAATLPRSERDQALVDGWPLYRTERGQVAFNDAMATLRATEGAAPATSAFKGCVALDCALSLPAVGADGWLAAGRIWVSPTDYVVIVHSPRLAHRQAYRRRTIMDMKFFVFHEFHNSSRNTDPYDTISSHSSAVFVPLYMSKSGTDATGAHFVVVVQVAPHDVVSVHASNMGSAGPGIEVAKNVSDTLEPLQALAGILVATMSKTAIPRLQVVNHRGIEGRPMLNAYEQRLASLRARPGATTVRLPFVPAVAQRVAHATGRLDDVLLRGSASPRVPMAERRFTPPSPAASTDLIGEMLASLSRVSARQQTLMLLEPIRPAVRPPLLPELMLIEPVQFATRPAALTPPSVAR